MIDKILKYKDNISILKGISEENIKDIVKECRMIKFEKGEKIIQQGDDTKNVFFLLEGGAKVMVKNKEVAHLKPRQSFGEFSVISNQKRNATIVATKTCSVISFILDLDIVDRHYSGFVGLYKNICNELIVKLDHANKRVS